jgi:hypothetical protein
MRSVEARGIPLDIAIRIDQRGSESLLRITYSDIGRDHFRWKADVSNDGGKTWRPDQIRIEATRVAPAAPG